MGLAAAVVDLPPLSARTAIAEWRADWPSLTVVVAALTAYLTGVLHLRRRGHAWPAGRVAVAILASGLLVVAAASSIAAYSDVLFWMDVVEHLLVAMVAPVLLAFARPVSLAVRALPPAGRAAMFAVLRSRVMAVACHPVLAFPLFVAAFVLPYYTPWFEATLRNPALHSAQFVGYLLLGCLLFWPLMGLDPMPGRVPSLFRQALLLVSLPVYVVVGLAAINQDRVFAPSYYSELDRGWGPAPSDDQFIGGAVLAWAGNGLTVVFSMILLLLWMREEGVRTRRGDMSHDRLEAQGRGEDTDLSRYNAWLRSLQEPGRMGGPNDDS